MLGQVLVSVPAMRWAGFQYGKAVLLDAKSAQSPKDLLLDAKCAQEVLPEAKAHIA